MTKRVPLRDGRIAEIRPIGPLAQAEIQRKMRALPLTARRMAEKVMAAGGKMSEELRREFETEAGDRAADELLSAQADMQIDTVCARVRIGGKKLTRETIDDEITADDFLMLQAEMAADSKQVEEATRPTSSAVTSS